MLKQILKKIKLHWLRSGVIIAPNDYKQEVYRIDKVQVNDSYSSKFDVLVTLAKIRQYAHVLEKGIYMPNRRVGFGKEKADFLKEQLRKLEQKNQGLDDPTYLWAKNIYKKYLEQHRLTKDFTSEIQPHQHTKSDQEGFLKIIKQRRSCRVYRDQLLEPKLIHEIIEIASYSPSSCNRQTNQVYCITDRESLQICEEMSSGGKGFAGMSPCILILAVDLRPYCLPKERHLAFVDSGIYSQSIMLAAEMKGLGTCFLNWASQTDTNEQMLRERFKIPYYYEITGLLCLGYPKYIMPLSARKRIEDTLINFF